MERKRYVRLRGDGVLLGDERGGGGKGLRVEEDKMLVEDELGLGFGKGDEVSKGWGGLWAAKGFCEGDEPID